MPAKKHALSKSSLAEYRRKRDFSKTQEPPGAAESSHGQRHALRFVIQKHAASQLHFDFRLELDGVMKSWAIPKGPSTDPAVKRLAIEVEDHPIEYNTFEGTIPEGEYGGGTVMLWDRGTYEAPDAPGAPDEEATLRRGYDAGKLDITLHGERLRGGWTLVRTRRRTTKPQWLLIKRRDDYAEPGSDIVATETTSVATGRTIEEIAGAGGTSRARHTGRSTKPTTRTTPTKPARRRKRASARATTAEPARPPRTHTPRLSSATFEPMLAETGADIPTGPGWTFEPKYDGIRVLAFVDRRTVRLMTRNGKDKATQFPEVADALRDAGTRSDHPFVLDGEIVALIHGVPARFQHLQSRVHLTNTTAITDSETETPAALIAFDLLADGTGPLLDLPWSERRRHLEALLRHRTSPHLRLGESSTGDGATRLEHARALGWEGIIAKRIDARYEPGKRSPAWLKLKVQYQQEFVVGGFTDPRNTRQYIGALIVGYFDHGRLVYAGHVGGGFDRAGLAAMYRRLEPLERKTSPFDDVPKTNEPAHWVRPEVVVEVKFSEWTADGKLRQPIFLGVRDDKDAHEVRREPSSVQRGKKKSAGKANQDPPSLADQLTAIERTGGAGTIHIARGKSLEVSHLDKVFFPRERYTKGDVMRYYARIASAILPVLADRPLVLKRSPDGIHGEMFFQQNAPPPDQRPHGVRTATLRSDTGEPQERLVGGDLTTLLYAVQLGCISMDPWLSRISSPDTADLAVLDLDPGPKATFRRVIEIARWVGEELDALGLHGALKTSGSRGIHIVLPLPAHTSYDTALALAQRIATRVADAHPKQATLARARRTRPAVAVYIDYLQNARGKSVAAAYAVRAKPGATVSAPLDWNELDKDLDLHDFTIETMPARLATLGDVWGQTMRHRNTARAIREAANL